MARIGNGRSNMANASARAKARKAGLIDSTRMRQLLQQGPDTIGTSIAEFGYRTEIDIYAGRLSGADLIEAALNHNLDTDFDSVLRFCQGRLKSMVAVYVERFSYQNAKTVLRAIHSGASSEMVAGQVLPEENLNNNYWLDIIRNCNTLGDAANAMSGTPWGVTLSKMDADSTLQQMEDALDSSYYSGALSSIRGPDGHPLLERYLRNEIDHRNIVNQFRGLRQGITGDDRDTLMIHGGKINKAALKAASQAESNEAILEILRRAPSFDDTGFEEALQASSNSLDPVVTLLQDQRRTMMRRFAHLNPISAFPIIHYIESKVLEVQNIRLLVRGKAAGLPDEVIEAHMNL
ncbi:MAG: V-type ATPase subunit [Candidatus Thalassarchaeaceae archaeon]|nr:V-type ATPase subunit [Candidatus Thalassarchaeaceae archaeon]